MPLSEKALENKIKYNIKYSKENYKRVPLDLKISKYEELKAEAEKVNEPINVYIKKAIDMRINAGKQ